MDNNLFSNLNSIISNGLNNIQINYTQRPKNYASGKSISYCPRMCYLDSKVTNEVTLGPLPTITAEYGKITETLFLRSLLEQNKLAGYDLTINTDLFPVQRMNYFGVVDAVVKDDSDNFFIIDIKTKGEIGDKEAFKAEDQDIAQLSFYASVTGLENVALVYVSRKVSEKFGEVTHQIIPLDIDRKHILHMAFFSSYCITNNVFAPIPKSFKRSKNCKYCSHYDICWSDKQVEFKYNTVTKDAYEITEQYAINYLTNIDVQREKFISLMLENKLRGKYFKSLEERN